MAGFNIHLAVGKRYTEKNKVKDTRRFFHGILEPDLQEEKESGHYTNKVEPKSLLSDLENKVIGLSTLF